MITSEDAGCWIDGHWGHYGPARLIDLALAYGMPDSEGGYARAVGDYALYSEGTWVIELADEAESWLNSVAPEGFAFGWNDGEFFLWPESVWNEEE